MIDRLLSNSERLSCLTLTQTMSKEGYKEVNSSYLSEMVLDQKVIHIAKRVEFLSSF